VTRSSHRRAGATCHLPRDGDGARTQTTLFSFGNNGYNMAMSEGFVEVFRLAVVCDAGAPALVRDGLEAIEEIELFRSEAKLVASELVSNAVRHSRCQTNHEIDVRVRLSNELVEISVHDPGLSDQALAMRENSDIGGLGLVIVGEIAHRWGTDRADGQVAWAQLSIPPSPAGHEGT
jgi:hypothetical protein